MHNIYIYKIYIMESKIYLKYIIYNIFIIGHIIHRYEVCATCVMIGPKMQ